MKKCKVIYVLLFVVALVFSSCSKDEETDNSDSNITVSTQELLNKIPESLEENSPETSYEIQYMINNMLLTEGFINSRSSARVSARTSRTNGETWTYGQYTVTYSEDSNATQYLFSYTVKDNNTVVYTIDGWVNKNGSAGHWDLDFLYGVSEDDDSLTIDFDWTKNSSNDYYLDMVYGYGTETSRLEAYINNNGSGELKSYDGTTLEFKSTWNANGSGSYTDYSSSPAEIYYY